MPMHTAQALIEKMAVVGLHVQVVWSQGEYGVVVSDEYANPGAPKVTVVTTANASLSAALDGAHTQAVAKGML